MGLTDITGQRFGRLIVLAKAEKRHYWHCICDCGKRKAVYRYSLLNGATQSCGCLHIERTIATSTRHGCSRRSGETAEYRIWTGMMSRCFDPNCNGFYKYGARGVVVCERWKTFENFLSDMGLRPSPGHSIDRIDVNGNYEPGNCRWATRKEQARNRRITRTITINGTTKPLSQWAEERGIPYHTLKSRVRSGWEASRLFQPVA